VATTPPGWLKPDDLSRRGTHRRALELLAAYLDEDQQEHAERYGGFIVYAATHVFLIPLDGPPWCAHADTGRVDRLCIAPDKCGRMPDGDVTLTYLLWIKADPEGFLREANVLSTRTIEWPDSETDLVRELADLARPVPPPSRRPKQKRPKKRTTALCLDAERIRAIFRNHGKEVPAELLRKLAPP